MQQSSAHPHAQGIADSSHLFADNQLGQGGGKKLLIPNALGVQCYISTATLH